MKKMILFAMLFACLGVQQVCAQKWAKKLGLAVAEGVMKDTKKTSTIVDKGTMIPGFSVKYTGCTISGNDAIIKAVITNNTGKEEKLSLLDTKAYDSNNAQHKVYLNIGGKDYSSFGLTTDAVPMGVPVKVTIRVENVSRDVAAISSCMLKVRMREKGGDYDWKIPTQNIVLVKNTNAGNIVCSNPDMSFNLRKCVRMGNKVMITATLMNNSGKEIKFYPVPDKTAIYDSDGETYRQDIDASQLANTYWSSAQRVTIPVGVPVKATFVIMDVPATVKEFSIAKFVYQLWNPNGDNSIHYFEIRNQAISAQ